MNTRGYTAYKRSPASITQRPDEVLLMLFEGAIRFVTLAKRQLDAGNTAAKGEYISKAMGIVAELDCSLDHDIGGDISANLSRLYQYMIQSLTQANINNDHMQLDEVNALLHQLQDAFTEAVRSEAAASMPQAVPQPSGGKGLNIAI